MAALVSRRTIRTFGAVIAVGAVAVTLDDEESQVLTDGHTIAQTTERQEVDGRKMHPRLIAYRWEATIVGQMLWTSPRLEDLCLHA
jgi:hypothetical protein